MASRSVEYIMSLQDKMSSGLDRINSKAFQLDNKMKSLDKTTNRLVSRMALIGTGIVIANVVKTAAKFQGLNNAISFASGSALEARNNLAFLDDIAARLGLNIQSTKKGFQTLSGAFVGTGVTAAKQREIFEQTGTAVSALNLSAADAEGVFLALGQIMSKGVVSSEELRRQLGNRIPGALGIAARAIGVTVQQLDKLLKGGELISADFLPKFTAELQRTFEGALPKSTISLQANINRLTNVFLKLKEAAGNEFAPAINSLAGTTEFLTANIGLIIKVTKIAIKSFIFFKVATFALTKGLRIYTTAVKIAVVINRAFTQGMTSARRSAQLLGLTMKANPIGILVTVLTAAVTAMGLFGLETDNATERLTVFGNKLDEINAKIGRNLFQGIVRGLVDPITKAFKPGSLETLTKALPNFAKSELESLKLFLQEQESALNRSITNAETGVQKSVLIQDLQQIQGAMKLLNLEFGKFKKAGANGLTGGNLSQTGITKITTRAPKIFNINIEKLVGEINNNVTNIKEGMAQSKEIVTEALLAALNDTQAAVR